MEFEGKLALVTGAASGIGAALTRIFVERGARVFATDLDADKLRTLARELGAGVIPYGVDLAEPSQVEAMVHAAIRALGGLDVLVNNAGIGSLARATDLAPEDWRRLMAVNLDAAFYAARAALPALIERRGNIVCTASVSGMAADYRFTGYNVSKAALIALVRSLAVDYAEEGVRVNAVSPGYTLTPLTDPMMGSVREAWKDSVPMRRAARPEEIAEVIAFLASARASYITGENVVVDGGKMAHTGQPDVYRMHAKELGAN